MILAIHVILGISLGLLFVAALLTLIRLFRGPTPLDRAVAIDVLTAAVIATIIILIAWWQRTDLMVLLIVFALTAFFSTVTVSKYVASTAMRQRPSTFKRQPDPERRPKPDGEDK